MPQQSAQAQQLLPALAQHLALLQLALWWLAHLPLVPALRLFATTSLLLAVLAQLLLLELAVAWQLLLVLMQPCLGALG